MTRCVLCIAMILAAACHSAPPVETIPSDPGLVELEAVLGNSHVPAASNTEMVARIRVVTREAAEASRPPMQVGLLIDTSGSMEGAAIEDARVASEELLRQLRAGDRLAVVAFSSRAELLVESTEITEENRESIGRALRRMQAHGTTDFAGGFAMMYHQMHPHRAPEQIDRLVVLSDGVPNDETAIPAVTQQFANISIPITTLGLGDSYNEVLLGDIAQRTGGRFHYVEDSQRVASVFREEVLRLNRVVARNSYLTLTPGPGVQIESVVGQNPTAANRDVQIHFGDLAAGETRDVLVRLRLPERRAGANVEVLDVGLGFTDAFVEAGALSRHRYLGARATDDIEALEAGRNAEIWRQAEEMQAAAIAIEALRTARYGSAETALEMLDAAEASDGGDPMIERVREHIESERRSRRERRRDRSAPSAAPAREIHEDAMNTLGY